jgi:ribonuclease D
LCLVQLATPAQVYIVDPLELRDLRALAEILEAVKPIKLIHNASFERGVFRKLGVTIRGAVDTVQLSRKRIGARAKGGHSLAAVCRRELNIRLDKTCQTSDWTRRPLTPAQYAYAALDAEVLHYIYRCLNDGEST